MTRVPALGFVKRRAGTRSLPSLAPVGYSKDSWLHLPNQSAASRITIEDAQPTLKISTGHSGFPHLCNPHPLTISKSIVMIPVAAPGHSFISTL